MAMTATKNIHERLLEIAETELPKHIRPADDYDPEYLDLGALLDGLSSRVSIILDEVHFEAPAYDITCYVWLCMPRHEGEAINGETFRGIPIAY